MATTTPDDQRETTRQPRASRSKNGRTTAKARSASSGGGGGASRRGLMKDHPFAMGAAAAAVGVVAGLAANLGRKAAMQAPAMMTGDWFESLKAEHKATLALFDKLQATSDEQTTRRGMILAQIKHALAKHAVEEENAVYPALREAGDKEQADQLNKEHGYVKQYLYELENMPRDDARWLSKAGELRRDLEQHMTDEDDRILPALKARLGAERNAKLTTAVNKEGFKLA